MLPNAINYYSAYKAKDARFDGRFFIAIATTGIYCRPICRARQPKEENCRYYLSCAEAEQAGYRPCLLCKPELAPGSSAADASATQALRAAKMLEEQCASGVSLPMLAERMGCTDRHLRRIFMAQYHVSPVQYLQTCRLLLAKNLLTQTDLSVLEVAMAAGFGSLRRFNDVFQSRYRLSPTRLRKSLTGKKTHSNAITLALGYRPPFGFGEMLDYLANRAIPGVERVENEAYLRTVRILDGRGEWVCGWIRVSDRPDKNMLAVTISDSLLRVLPKVLSRVRHLFDLCCDPQTIFDALAPMNQMRAGLCVLGTRLPGCFDAYEMAVRAVLGQQITVKAATTLAGRLVKAFGHPIQTDMEGLTHCFPTPEEMLALGLPIESHLGPLGIISTRARTIHALAQALYQGDIFLDVSAQPLVQIARLKALPGIGDWTAQYIAMRTMGYTDAFLETDAGVKKALAPMSVKERINMAQRFRPWRSYVTVNLWRSLTTGRNEHDL